MEIYLDNSATTRCFPEAAKLMYKVLTEDYGNPSSLHQKGVDAEKYVREAKEIIAKNPKAIADYKGGKEKALGALVGQTMKAMKGKANPGMVNQKLREMLK